MSSDGLESGFNDSLSDLNLDLDSLDLDSEGTASETTTSFASDASFFKNIPVDITLEVASKSIALGDLMQAGEGSVIELNKMNGEPLDVKVNGKLFGHAEVVIVNDKYAIKLTELADSAAKPGF